MPWDEAAFQRRIRDRAKSLELSVSEVLRRAGVDSGSFNKDKLPGAQGRTYNVIESIAGAVGMTVGEAIGETTPLSIQLLETAVQVALSAIPGDQPELTADAIISAYDVLSERQQANESIDSSYVSALIAILRRQARGRSK